jgi:tetratricopeptide (TPR) repeat protein
MPSERTQRQIDRLLDAAEQAIGARDWVLVREHAEDVLRLDPDNEDARSFLAAAQREPSEASPAEPVVAATTPGLGSANQSAPSPDSFANGRYTVKKFLGEGGKKKVYLAHDTLLDRDVAFALIKTEGLDDIGRDRIKREAQAMGRLGAHPHIVSVFDLGEEANGQPYIVTELMKGGDVEGVIEKAPEHRPPLERTLQIGMEVCRGLEFAHSHGIVHRDLKPGNVWLAEDGTAKLGDFGLAVALDKTRLTQAGMMVGTVSYMPPEQATGGAVTPRSDLYSLGAMLYEMLTGRPPFLGEDSIAIIGQHLNTAPVSPTWHRPDCPPGLEALILRLLEKDPAKRPAAATEVRAVLDGLQNVVSQAATGATFSSRPEHSVPATPASPDNPLYRRVFVGREAELKQLQAAFDAALSGQGSLAMVVGEPGIGKTSVCEQLTTYVALRGGKVLVGHCYEEGSLSLPYLPFVEALRSYVLARDPEGLKQDLGSGGPEVARIVSEVRDRVVVELREAGDPEEDRWRLLQAVAGFLRNASTVQPLLLVLEDLHDADRGTLDLLVHLAHNLASSRLLVVGTYRDVEVDRAHPLSATLAELRRTGGLLRLALRGLTVDEVHRMYEAIRGNTVPWAQAELVYRQTEGNPLFIQEVLRYLVEEGIVIREGGRYVRADDRPADSLIPEGLRDVVGRRLSRLSPQANQALGVAAVIGREFRLDVLQQVAGMGEEELYGALEEATGRAVVEQRQIVGTVAFRFSHAFFRQTLYDELFIPRRIRLHQQVGRALEVVYGTRLEEHAAELAEHFVQSTEAGDLAKALRYSELAAQRSLAVFAYGEAAQHWERALRTQEVLDPEGGAKRCDLLVAMGEAMLLASESERGILGVAAEALALAEGLNDSLRAARVSLLALDTISTSRGGPAGTTVEYGGWLELADRYAPPGTYERLRTEQRAVGREIVLGRQRAAVHRARRALALARELGNEESLCSVAAAIFNCRVPEVQEERLELAEELADHAFAGVRPRTLGYFLFFAGGTFLVWGQRARAQEMWRRRKELAERTKDASMLASTQAQDVYWMVIEGQLQEAIEAVVRMKPGEAFGLNAPALFFSTIRAFCYLGRAQEALAAEPEEARIAVAEGRSLVFTAQTALMLAHLGRWQEVEQFFAELRVVLSDPETAAELGYSPLAHYLEAAVMAGDGELAAQLLPLLAPVAGLINELYPTTNARHLGAASALLGEREQAKRYYVQALEVADKVGFRYEIALTHLGIAELFLEDGNQAHRADALQHLDLAIAEFRDMKMQPPLERALRHKEVLKA